MTQPSQQDEQTPAQPYVAQLAPGEYWWCACGRSSRLPFCDGPPSAADCTPLRFTVTRRPRIVWLCGCGHSRHKPYCDGRHNRLPGKPR